MNMTPAEIPIIETRVFKHLTHAVTNLATAAGLGIAKGPVGIGKTFAIDNMLPTLDSRGITAHVVTVTPEIEGSIVGFCNAAFEAIWHAGVTEGRILPAIEILAEALLSGRPFGDPARPLVLIVDEAQGLKTPLLETLCGVWDKGDRARRGRQDFPAFGLMLIGNDQFLSKRGRVRQAEYSPLRDRVTYNLPLPGPEEGELRQYANGVANGNPELATVLFDYGRRKGNYRAIQKALFQAQELGEGRATAETGRFAITLMGDA